MVNTDRHGLVGVDLNLLVALDALLSERSVTRAAQRMGLSQPAMSNALARLRDLLDDPVFVRKGQGMEPTARALELSVPVHRLLEDARQALARPRSFDPKTSAHRFHIESTDAVELSLLPQLAPGVARLGPHVDLVMTRATKTTEEELRTGRADLYLGSWSKVPAHLHRHLLRQEGFACIARHGHPRTKKSRLTLRAYAELGHVIVAQNDCPGGASDTVLVDEGLGRRVSVRTPHVLVAARIVARSDAIATLPRGVALALADLLPIDVLRPPIDVSDVPIYMVWHPRTHEQAPHRWLRGLIMDVVAAGAW
jgi:DNA-binding transcriptional LysR family regulator